MRAQITLRLSSHSLMNLRCVALLSALLLPSAIWAEELYRVELIVFTQPYEADVHELYDPISPIDTSAAIDFRQYSCRPIDHEDRPLSLFTSKDEVAACLNGFLRLNELSEPMIAERLSLEKSPAYKVLHHVAWRQPALDPKRASAVRLTNMADTSNHNTAVLDGTVKLSQEQFLQLDIELTYLPERTATANSTEMPQGLALRILRKLRSGNLNYMDHPLLGILAKVTKIEEEENSDTDSQADAENS